MVARYEEGWRKAGGMLGKTGEGIKKYKLVVTTKSQVYKDIINSMVVTRGKRSARGIRDKGGQIHGERRWFGIGW